MRVEPFWGGALVLATALAGCSSMKAAILGSDEENAGAGAAEPSDAPKNHPPVGAYGVSKEPPVPTAMNAKEITSENVVTPPAAEKTTAPVAAPDAAAPHAPETLPPTSSATVSPSTARAAATPPVTAAKEPETSIEGIPVKPLNKKDLEQDAKRDFERATALLQNGQESQALVSFTDFLRRYPEHKLVGDAQFFIGEIFYRQRKYAEALHELQKVKDLLKGGSQRTPDAFVKIGECHLKLGKTDRARIEWNAVKRRFPGTAAALQADVLLKGLPR